MEDGMSIFKDPTLNAMVNAVDNPKKVKVVEAPDIYSHDHVKVRYLVQSLVTIPPDKLPDNFQTMTVKEVWAWIQEYWKTLSAEDLLAAMLPEFAEDVMPAMVEVYRADLEDYQQIIQTNEWDGYWYHEHPERLTEETEEALDSPWKEVEL